LLRFDVEYVLFASGIVLFFFACSQLLTTSRAPIHYSMFIACIALSYSFLYIWAVRTGVVRRLPPVLLFSDVSANFFGVIGFYVTSQTILRGSARPVRRYAAYYVPPTLFAVGFAVRNAITNPDVVLELKGLPGYVNHPVLRWLGAAVYFLLVAAILLNLALAHRLHPTVQPEKHRAFRTQVKFLSIYLVPALIALVGSILGDANTILVAATVFAVVAASFTLTATSIVYFSPGGGMSELRRVSARPEWNETANELTVRVNELMDSSAPYLDEDLTLPELARMLEVEPKRLSYHFNVIMRTNFRGYINALRLDAVRSELLANPESPILEIAFENGFNSKSSFNMLFKKRYGVTPREIRTANMSAEEPSGVG
jgi:AraC-like DNA-binding protein